MKTILFLFCLMASLAFPQASTYSARRIQSGTALPGSCNASSPFTDVFIKTNVSITQQFYVCTSSNTWTQQGGGGSGTINSSTAGYIGVYSAATTIDGYTNAQYLNTAVSVPSAPTVTPTCTVAGMETCSTLYRYQIALSSVIGPGAPSASGTTMVGPDTLTSTNKNTITSPACTGTWYIYRFTNAGTVGNTGLIGTSNCGSNFADTGFQGNFYNPSFDQSIGQYVGARLRGPDLGNQTDQFRWGSAETSFSAGARQLVCCIGSGFYHTGSASNLGNGAFGVAIEGTGGVQAFSAIALGTDTNTVYGFTAYGGNSGSALIAEVVGGNFFPGFITGSGNITTGQAAYVRNGQTLTGGTGTLANQHGFACEDLTFGTSTNACFFSEMTVGSGKLSINDSGGAGIKTTGNLDAASFTQAGTAVGSNNAAVCWKTTTTLGHCTSVVGAGGTCTCS